MPLPPFVQRSPLMFLQCLWLPVPPTSLVSALKHNSRKVAVLNLSLRNAAAPASLPPPPLPTAAQKEKKAWVSEKVKQRCSLHAVHQTAHLRRPSTLGALTAGDALVSRCSRPPAGALSERLNGTEENEFLPTLKGSGKRAPKKFFQKMS